MFSFSGATAGSQVTLSWISPEFNCDGSDLDDLSGYVVMWGDTSGGPYTGQHSVDDPNATSAVVDITGIENTTIYFVAVSVDTSGNRSDDVGGCGYSNEYSHPFPRTYPEPPSGVVGQ